MISMHVLISINLKAFSTLKKPEEMCSWITYFEILALIVSVALPLKTTLLLEVNFIFFRVMLKHIEQLF